MKTSKPKTALVFWLVGVAHAQTIPDAGTLFRQAEQNLPMNRQAAPLIALPPLPLAINLERDGEKKAVFQAFKFTGNKRLKEEVLQAAISVFRQQEIPFKDLHRIPQAIEDASEQRKFKFDQQWAIDIRNCDCGWYLRYHQYRQTEPRYRHL